ncbi:MAG TPA: hypothetical protein PLS05_06150 [Clostridia bacterium]|nr:hypothetical protein [Clostridia bacterium]HOL61440.1 hypothetical protein [Clostridia bacterium]HPO53700.1 hypothetical protein [Clostridia bacterium]
MGLILYLTWRNDQPKNARKAGQGALISVIAGFVSLSLYIAFFVILAMIAGGN